MKMTNALILTGVAGMLLTACGTSGGSNNQSKDNGKYVTEIKIAVDGEVKKETGFDAVVEPNKTVQLSYTFDPADATETTIKWVVSNTKVAGITRNPSAQLATFTGKDEGEVTVHLEMPGAKNTTISSNELKIKVEGNYKKNADFDYAKTTYTIGTKTEDLNVNTLYKNQGSPHQDPLGENHVLVIPFGFNDNALLERQNKNTLDHINMTFFGKPEELEKVGAWESLQSFYSKSSYGKTNFVGYIPDSWCVYDGTAASFKSKYNGNLGAAAADIGRSWYLKEYDKAGHGSLGENAKPIEWFDNNGDGYIDLIWVVYSQPTGTTEDWWAYVTYTGNVANKAIPTIKTLGFASIDWMQKSLNGYDPHTYIHETGHTFGLPDYYDYNHTWSPMGGVDFMDHNLGDHSMYSKFTLGWTKPLVVDEDAIITLRPGTTTGDCFVIPSPNYNGTAFDEYMMVELMAPVGLAERDYKAGYEGTEGFKEPGLRITHCDSRVYNRANGNSRDNYLVSNPQDGIDYRIDNSYGGRSGLKVDGDYFPVKNAKGDEVKNYMTLYSIMESVIDPDNNWTKSSTYSVNSSALFKEGHSFTLSSKRSWAETFMPSKTNLWNKAKTITGWKDSTTQTYAIDETCTFNYVIKCLSIEPDAEFGYVAKVQVTANAY